MSSSIRQRATTTRPLRPSSTAPRGLPNISIQDEIAETTSKVLKYIRKFEVKIDEIPNLEFGELSPINSDSEYTLGSDLSVANQIPSFLVQQVSFVNNDEPLKKSAPTKRDIESFVRNSHKYGIKNLNIKQSTPSKARQPNQLSKRQKCKKSNEMKPVFDYKYLGPRGVTINLRSLIFKTNNY